MNYQVGILGDSSRAEDQLGSAIRGNFADLGLDLHSLSILRESEISQRNRKLPFVGVFFGYPGASDENHSVLSGLVEDSVVIIPCVDDIASFTSEIPPSLHHINGHSLSGEAPTYPRLACLILENFRLLRAERRLFISYRRSEAQRIAIQLYEKLDALGFDVFLDIRSVPPGKDFQGILWHRMADSDIVVLLDTPGFLDKRWTREELAQANATSIQILHLLWPDTPLNDSSAFSHFHQLASEDFVSESAMGAEASLASKTVERIGPIVESLRARALAARHRYLVDQFCDQAHALGRRTAVQTERFVALEVSATESIAVVPVIGVPSASRYQEIETAIGQTSSKAARIWLLYDERGIVDTWIKHIDWLNAHLPISAVRVSESSHHIEGVGQ